MIGGINKVSWSYRRDQFIFENRDISGKLLESITLEAVLHLWNSWWLLPDKWIKLLIILRKVYRDRIMEDLMAIDLGSPEAGMVKKDLEFLGAIVTAVAEVRNGGQYIFYHLHAEWPDGKVWEIREIQNSDPKEGPC